MNDDINKIAQEAAKSWCDTIATDGPPLDTWEFKMLVEEIESACKKAMSIGHDAGFKMGRSVNVLPAEQVRAPRASRGL